MTVVTKKRDTKSVIYKGTEALNAPTGSVLKFIRFENKKECNTSLNPLVMTPLDTLVMRTNNDNNPFLTLENGNLWGSSIEGYVFEYVDVKHIELFIN